LHALRLSFRRGLIVVAALVAGIVVSGLALSSRTTPDQGSQQAARVIKAGKSVTITSSDALVIR
jgi:hypothetical protein